LICPIAFTPLSKEATVQSYDYREPYIQQQNTHGDLNNDNWNNVELVEELFEQKLSLWRTHSFAQAFTSGKWFNSSQSQSQKRVYEESSDDDDDKEEQNKQLSQKRFKL
jgi:hypothetical protein